MRPDEIALSYFESGFNCAESVLMAVGEALQLDGLRLPPLATGFGAGVARKGHLCGCLSGTTMAVGLAVGSTNGSDQESKELVYEIAGRIFDKFYEKLHTIECRELTGIDFSAGKTVPDELAKAHKQVCCPLVSFTTILTIAELRAHGLPQLEPRTT